MRVRRYRVKNASIAFRALLAFAAFTRGFAMPEAHAQQVVLTNARGLDFGRFVAAGGGSVTLSPSGVRTRTGNVILLTSPNAGQSVFNVSRNGSGGANKAVSITLPANGSTRLVSGANSMAVGSFVSSPAILPSISSGGSALGVGATLSVAPNQPPGTYSGSFSLIVNFQ